ncbi:MAG: sugar phosphate isomerase/epimerase [Abitibacteriaceae bacterium]|nr:sugar phosphate isomerase/epimerase [Abditibacteriaceae bacterium]MBV9864330.1 sugar phosphate isomerase/epimerase [Abditibacteriaceae bacterium]
MSKIPIGLQLYSIREDAAKDLPGVLKAVAQMGYDGVEFAGYYGHSAQDIRKMLDDNGLKCCGTHTGLNTLTGDELQRTVEFNKTLGNPYLIVPGLPQERTNSRAAWLETAQIFNDIAQKLESQEMQTGYHNHHTEFTPLDGEMPWDTFFGNTRQDVIMQLDTGNALHGAADPTPFLERYPGRAITVHLKEHSATNDKALIGEGDVNWDVVFKLCEDKGNTKWYIVEQESYAYPPLECVDRCLQKLREMGK